MTNSTSFQRKTYPVIYKENRLPYNQIRDFLSRILICEYFFPGSLDTEAEDLAADEQVAKLFEADRLESRVRNNFTIQIKNNIEKTFTN